MKLTANRKSLLFALNSVGVAMSNRNGNPLAPYMLIRADSKSRITLAADSTQLRAEAVVECAVDKTGAVLVSHQKLMALLQRESKDVVLTESDGRLAVTLDGNLGAHLPLMVADGFPAARPDADQKAFVILDGKTFGYALSVVCPCAGDGVAHTWNPGVNIRDDGTNLSLCAGDGHQFCRLLLPPSGTEFEITLPAKMVRPLSSALQACGDLTMTVFDKGVKFVSESLSLFVQAMDVVYSRNVTQICDQLNHACDSSITLPREQFSKAVGTAAAMLDDDSISIGFEISDSPQAITVRAHSKHNGEYSEEILCKVATPLSGRRVGYKVMSAHLRSLDCENITLYYSADEKVAGYRIASTVDGSWSWYAPYNKSV